MGFALIVLYTAVRIWRLDDACLWFDEIFSVHAAEHDWRGLFAFVAQDLVHPPLYYAILKIWIAVGGDSIFWLRFLSVMFAVLALFPILLLAKELKFESSTILLALFFLSVNGSLINYTQRVRMYTLLMFLSMFSIWLFSRYFYRGKGLASLVIVNIFLIYTHYFGSLIIGCEIAAVLVFQRIKWRGAAVIFAGGICFIPWIYAVLLNLTAGSDAAQNIGWISRPGLREIGVFIIDLVEPFYFQFGSDEPTSVFVVSIPLLIVLASSAIFFLTRMKGLEASEKRRILFLAGFVLVPIAAVLAASWISPYSVWGTRHLIICAGPLALLVSAMVMRLDHRIARTAVISSVVLISAIAFFLQAARPPAVYVWCHWDRVGSEFAAVSENHRIYAFESLIAYHVWFAARNTGNTEVFDVSGVDSLKVNEEYFLPRGFSGVLKTGLKDISGDRVWLIFRTHGSGEENAMFESLRQRRYNICPATPMRFGKTNVFTVEVVKAPLVCSDPR